MMNLTILVYCDKCSGELEVVECKSYPASIRVKPCKWCPQIQRAEQEGRAEVFLERKKAS